MFKLRSASIVALTSLTLLMTACQKKAEGQVVAIVNGEEITLSELNTEIADLNVPASADKEAVRNQVLQRMIDRRLLVQAAKEAGLDRDPQYLSQERRMREQLLVSMYGKKTMDSIRVPDTATIDKYITAHPTAFADRKRFKLDQLQIDPPSDPNRLKELESAHSLAEVANRLTAMNIAFQRGTGTLDSAGIAPDMLQRLEALPPGEPFIVPANGKLVINAITGVESIALTPEQARPIAAQTIRNEELNKIGEERLKEAKAKAKIEYQPGYEAKETAGAEALPKPANAMAPAGN